MAKSNLAKTPTANAIASLGKARGDAVATNFLREVANQGKTLCRFLIDVARLDKDGRQAFRLALQTSLDSQREVIKTHKAKLDDAIKAGAGDEEVAAMREELYRMDKTFRSSTVRVSEARTFANAIDKLHVPDVKRMEKDGDYHGALAAAKVHLRAVGLASNRGRKATPVTEKIIKYVQRFYEEGAIELETLKATMAAISKAAPKWEHKEQPKAEETKPEVKARKIGPTQRKERKVKGSAGFVPAKTPTHDVPATHQ